MKGDGSTKGASRKRKTRSKNLVIGPDHVVDCARPVVVNLLEHAAPDLTRDKHGVLVDLCLAAASQATSIADACRTTAKAPSERTAQRHLSTIELDALEQATRDELWEQARPHLPRRVIVSIDWTEVPYHGDPHEHDDELKRSKAKDGTTWFHTYATLYSCVHNKRYTLSVRFVRKHETPTQVLEMLLEEMRERGLRPRLVLTDKGFCTVAAVRLLRRHGLAFIIPLALRGKKAKALCRGRGAHWATYEFGGKKGEDVRVAVVAKRNKGKYHGKKPGNQYFPYIADGVGADPKRVDRLYRKRVGIESSYRLMNQARARTSTRNPAVRLFYFTLSFILQNAWVQLSWLLSAPKRGHTGRHRPKGHFPLKQFLRLALAWVLDHYGTTLTVEQPPRWRAPS